jgi:RNA polymerase sigma-70 factor (ECF subfamily)
MENALPADLGMERVLEALELSELLDTFLASLAKLDRRLFVCRYWYFDTIQEIAERFGCSEGKVKMRLKRTRDKLADHLKREGYAI